MPRQPLPALQQRTGSQLALSASVVQQRKCGRHCIAYNKLWLRRVQRSGDGNELLDSECLAAVEVAIADAMAEVLDECVAVPGEGLHGPKWGNAKLIGLRAELNATTKKLFGDGFDIMLGELAGEITFDRD